MCVPATDEKPPTPNSPPSYRCPARPTSAPPCAPPPPPAAAARCPEALQRRITNGKDGMATWQTAGVKESNTKQSCHMHTLA